MQAVLRSQLLKNLLFCLELVLVERLVHRLGISISYKVSHFHLVDLLFELVVNRVAEDGSCI